ncbi:hypothetical protein ACFWOY_20825 [Streptomyces sp. NPDC058423]|uniref:hypothetical protein n=1 Tax=unclassified Streptomyces TaxID=2593676 RepID=UPI00365C4F9C
MPGSTRTRHSRWAAATAPVACTIACRGVCSLRWSSAGTRDNSGKLDWRISDRIPLWVECAIPTTGFKPTPAKRRLAGGSPAIHIALVNGSRPVLAVVDDRVVGAVAFEVSHGKVASLRGIAATDRRARLNAACRQHEPEAPVITAW